MLGAALYALPGASAVAMAPMPQALDAGGDVAGHQGGTCKNWCGVPKAQDVRPMQCGVLWFVHIPKNGGSTTWDYLKRNAAANHWKTAEIGAPAFALGGPKQWKWNESDGWRDAEIEMRKKEPKLIEKQKPKSESDELDFLNDFEDILKDKAQHEAFVDRFHQGGPSRKALAKRSAGMGSGGIQECYQGSRTQPSLQDYVIHYTVQSLQNTFAVGQPSSGHNPIWLTEGTALYFTKLMKDSAVWSCVDLTKSGTGQQKASKDPKDWPFIIRTFVKEGKDPDINAVLKCANFAELDGPETVKAWSIIDFLMSDHREKFIEFCKDLRASTDNGESSFKKVFGWTPQDLDNRWRAYAKQAYIGL